MTSKTYLKSTEIASYVYKKKHPERYVPLGTYMNGCI